MTEYLDSEVSPERLYDHAERGGKSAGRILLVVTVLVIGIVAEAAGDKPPARKQTLAAEVDVGCDMIDMTHHSQVPLDERWYDTIFSRCRRYGVRRVYWRVSLGQAYYRSHIMAPVSAEGNSERRIVRLAEILAGDGPEPLELAVRFAHRHGVKLIAWFPFNETHYVRPGLRDLIDPWYAERTELYWCDRQEKRVWMGMPCVAEPEVVKRTAAIVEELCGYGVDGVFLTPRTHCYRPNAPGEAAYKVHPDYFGYNKPIRRRYQQRHGVDIRREEFDVAAWHKIKGEFYTELLAACAKTAHRHGKLLLAGTLPQRIGYAPAARFPKALQIENQWRAWREQAKVDGIVSIQSRVRLPQGTQSIPPDKIASTTLDAGVIVRDAPGCPVYVFHPILAFRPAGGGSWSLIDRLMEPPGMLCRRLELAHQQGARGLVLHEGYVPLFLDTDGNDTGVGPCPQMKYWEAIGRWTGAAAASATK